MKLSNLFRFPGREKRSTSSTGYISLGSPGAWQMFGGGRVSDSGEVVSEATALSVATVYSCVRILSESVASLPLRLYRRTTAGRMEALDAPLHFLLTVAPNSEMTAFTFVETLLKGMLLTGTAYAEVERSPLGDVLGLWPLNPRVTRPVRLEDGTLVFETTDGMTGGQNRVLAAEDVLHVPMFASADGLVGMGPLQVTMSSFGQAIACDRFAGSYFRNFATPSLALTVPDEVDAKSKAAMRQDWEQLQSGSNAFRVAILDQGMGIERLSISPDEAQFIETKKLLREDIAGIFRVPLYMLGSSERLSQASAEQMSLSFVTDTLRPIAERLCQEIARKLLNPKPGEPAEFVVESDFAQRLRGDTAAATAYYKTAIQSGWMSPNEVRRELHLNEGPASLSIFQVPVNVMNSDKLLDPSQNGPTTPALPAAA